jgi:hypothetical protein
MKKIIYVLLIISFLGCKKEKDQFAKLEIEYTVENPEGATYSYNIENKKYSLDRESSVSSKRFTLENIPEGYDYTAFISQTQNEGTNTVKVYYNNNLMSEVTGIGNVSTGGTLIIK